MDSQNARTLRMLVPVDGSALAEQAVPLAVAAGAPKASIHLLRVVPPPKAVTSLWGGVVVAEDVVSAVTAADAAADLERAKALVPLDVTVQTETVQGDPADQIIQSARRHAVDLIVMASHGRGAMGRWTFGSVADRVARQSPIPVLIVCPDPDKPVAARIERLVVPLDGSDLAVRALPVATRAAQRLHVPVLLVRVINPMNSIYPAIAVASPISDEAYQDAFEREEVEIEQMFAEATGRLREAGVDVTTRLLAGPTVPSIESVIADGDVVIITSHGRSGIRRWLLGSVAERLIRDGKAPVLLVPSVARQPVAEPQPVEGLALARQGI